MSRRAKSAEGHPFDYAGARGRCPGQAFAWLTACFLYLAGSIPKAFGLIRSFNLMNLIYLIGAGICILFGNYPMLLAGLIIAGFASGADLPISLTVISHDAPDEKTYAELELPRRYSFRYVELKVVDTSSKWQAVFSDPVVTAESSADMEALAPLKLEDPELQKIYDVGVKTLADCMQDVFEDGPKRDRRLWLGDLRLQALANYATFDRTDLVKRCLYLFAAMTTEEGRISANVFTRPKNVPDDTFLFEYSLFFISTLYDLHQAHPDPDLVKELYPVAKGQMDITLKMVDENGKLITDDDYPVFVDWSNDFNKDTAGQAEVIYCLKQFIALADLVGEEDLGRYKEALDKISSYARERLYDPEKALFVTTGERVQPGQPGLDGPGPCHDG